MCCECVSWTFNAVNVGLTAVALCTRECSKLHLSTGMLRNALTFNAASHCLLGRDQRSAFQRVQVTLHHVTNEQLQLPLSCMLCMVHLIRSEPG